MNNHTHVKRTTAATIMLLAYVASCFAGIAIGSNEGDWMIGWAVFIVLALWTALRYNHKNP